MLMEPRLTPHEEFLRDKPVGFKPFKTWRFPVGLALGVEGGLQLEPLRDIRDLHVSPRPCNRAATFRPGSSLGTHRPQEKIWKNEAIGGGGGGGGAYVHTNTHTYYMYRHTYIDLYAQEQ